MSDVNALFARRDALESDQRRAIEFLDEKIYAILAVRFAGNKALAQAFAKLESKPDGYQFDEGGEIEAWARFDFSDFDEREHPYLHDWLLDQDGCVRADFDNGALVRTEGESILIVEGYRRSGSAAERLGVVSPSGEVELDDFTDADGDVDEERLAWLIEQHMEHTGYFPNVFYVTSYGSSQDVKLWPTAKRAEAYALRLGYKTYEESVKANARGLVERRLEAIDVLAKRRAYSAKYDCFSIMQDDDGNDGEAYFCSSGCDVCESGGNDVFDVTFLARADIDNVHDGQICGACLCALVNGDDSDLDLGTLKA